MHNKFYYCSNTIHCSGGVEHCPGPHDTVAYFTQIVLDGHCTIPEPKPDSEKLIDVFHTIEVLKATTVGSEEFIHGHLVKGKKVIVAGTIQLGIEYSALCSDQKVHFFECEIPFNAIILGCVADQDHLFPVDFCLDDYLVRVCVEHLQIHPVSEREFEKVIVLMIWLQPNDNYEC